MNIQTQPIQGAEKMTVGHLDANRITAVNLTSEARIAKAAYERCLAMTADTAEQTQAAWKYTALAKESCARAGLFEESLHLCTLLLKWSYLHDRLTQRLKSAIHHQRRPHA